MRTVRLIVHRCIAPARGNDPHAALIGYHARMTPKCIALALDWLAGHSSVPAGQRQALARLAPALLEALPSGDGWLLGLAGAPGTGKSTLAHMLAAIAERTGGESPGGTIAPIVVLSLDDYYLTRDERQRLARTVHPALAQRGVPGTHDQARLFEDIDRLIKGHRGTLAVPAFDKARDDRSPHGRVLTLDGRPARVLVEGWLIGTPPLPPRAPQKAMSSGNPGEDALQAFMATQHAALYRAWRERAAALWALAARDFETVRDWRWQQEQDLPASRRLLKSPSDVARFLQPFEALVRYQLGCGYQWADLVIQLDRDHLPHLQCAP